MRTILSYFKSMSLGRNFLWFLAMMLVGAAMFYITAFVLTPFGPMSRFPAAVLLIYIGILCLVYMDRIHHSQIDTTKAIRDNNVSYAIIMLAYAVIIAAVITTV